MLPARRGTLPPRSGGPWPVLRFWKALSASASIIAVDRDILLGEVAGPYRRPAAAEPDIDAYADPLLFHVRGYLGFRIGRVALAAVRQAVVAEPDRQAVAVGRLAGLADRHHDAPPIG